METKTPPGRPSVSTEKMESLIKKGLKKSEPPPLTEEELEKYALEAAAVKEAARRTDAAIEIMKLKRDIGNGTPTQAQAAQLEKLYEIADSDAGRADDDVSMGESLEEETVGEVTALPSPVDTATAKDVDSQRGGEEEVSIEDLEAAYNTATAKPGVKEKKDPNISPPSPAEKSEDDWGAIAERGAKKYARKHGATASEKTKIAADEWDRVAKKGAEKYAQKHGVPAVDKTETPVPLTVSIDDWSKSAEKGMIARGALARVRKHGLAGNLQYLYDSVSLKTFVKEVVAATDRIKGYVTEYADGKSAAGDVSKGALFVSELMIRAAGKVIKGLSNLIRLGKKVDSTSKKVSSDRPEYLQAEALLTRMEETLTPPLQIVNAASRPSPMVRDVSVRQVSAHAEPVDLTPRR